MQTEQENIENVANMDNAENVENVENIAKVENAEDTTKVENTENAENVENIVIVENAENTVIVENIAIVENVENKNDAYFEESTTQSAIEQAAADEASSIVEHIEVDFSGMDKAQLWSILSEHTKEEDVNSISATMRLLREAYVQLVKKETELKITKFIEDGGMKEDFEMPKDSFDTKFELAFSQYRKKQLDLKAQKEKQLVENTAAKKIIIEELKALLQTDGNISKKYHEFQALQGRWRDIGNVVPAEANNLWQNYKFSVSQFFDIMKISKELRELDMRKNLELKTEFCERAEKLHSEKSLRKAVEELRVLQEKWKEIGYATTEANELVWKRFKAAADVVYDRLKENEKNVKAIQLANLAAKTAICEQLEQLIATDCNTPADWQKANEKVQAFWIEWQKIGYVVKEDKNATWNRFKQLRQKFYFNKDAFYTKLKDDFSKNLALKVALCEKAESLIASTDWSSTTETFKRMQADWKKIGTVARKDSDAVWKRFKKAGDTYFENKAKHFANKDAQLLVNHTAKMEVIEKINTLAVTDDNRVNLEALKKLSEEFRAIGEVPSKMFQELANHYRKTVDAYFQKIKAIKGSDDKSFQKMKYEQMQETAAGKQEIGKERHQLQERIKKLETEVNQLENNLSFFGKSTKTDSLKEEFIQKLEKGKAEIKKLKEQLKLIPVH